MIKIDITEYRISYASKGNKPKPLVIAKLFCVIFR